MPIKLNISHFLPNLAINIKCIELRQNFLTDLERKSWRPRNFSDVNSQAKRITRLNGAHHIKGVGCVNTSLRVFIEADSPLVQERVASIHCASSMAIVGQAKTRQDSIEEILDRDPDVVVPGVQLKGDWTADDPRHSPYNATRRFRCLYQQFLSQVCQMLPDGGR